MDTDILPEITEGGRHSYVTREGGELVFHKGRPGIGPVVPNNLMWLRSLELGIREWILQGVVVFRSRHYPADVSDMIRKEARTINLWKQEGITVPRIRRQDDKEIVYDFIENSVSYKKLLESGDDKFDVFLTLYDRIRSLARERRDLDLFHSDPQLENFLFHHYTGEAIPIDPEVMLNPDAGFDYIDTSLLAFTLNSIAGLELEEDKVKSYLRRFKGIMSEEEVENVLGLEHHISVIPRAYMLLREELVHRIKGREKHDVLAEVRTIESNYDNLVEPVLLE